MGNALARLGGQNLMEADLDHQNMSGIWKRNDLRVPNEIKLKRNESGHDADSWNLAFIRFGGEPGTAFIFYSRLFSMERVYL